MHFDVSLATGMLPHITVGTPGTHGAAVTGMHGIGVSTPSAAAVAAATMGFAGLEHMPNGITFKNGLLSMMLAIGVLASTRFTGSTLSTEGATPNEHCS